MVKKKETLKDLSEFMKNQPKEISWIENLQT
jgi:hypothetical protein